MRKLPLALIVAVCVTLVSGCSWFQVGEEEFACSGMPGSVFCHSAREVYNRTNNGSVPSPIHGNTYNPKCTDCVRAEDEAGSTPKAEKTEAHESAVVTDTTVYSDEVHRNYVTPNLPNRPVPVRTPAQIMRIWIGPYVDTSGDLVSPGLVYTEIEPRRWIYPDQKNALNNRIMKPLEGGNGANGSGNAGFFGNLTGNGRNGVAGDANGRKSEAAAQPEFSALENFAKNKKSYLYKNPNK